VANPRISLSVVGTDPPHRHVRATDFVRELQLLLSALRQVEWQIRPSKGSAVHYHIVELTYASPATVVIEPLETRGTTELSSEIVSTFASLVRDIDSGRPLAKRVSYTLLKDIAGLVAPVNTTLSSVTVSAGGDIFPLTKAFQRHIEELLRPEETCPGFIRGMLEAINLHRGANLFRIYPDVGPAKVSCHFPAELQNAAVGALGEFVEVRGTLKYKAASPYPYEVEVGSIETLPDQSTLPTLSELRGVAPRATGSRSSEEFVRSLRNASD